LEDAAGVAQEADAVHAVASGGWEDEGWEGLEEGGGAVELGGY
jgi:hypothetical protein